MKTQRSSTPESTGSDTISLSLVLQSSQGSGPRSSSILRLMIILTLPHHNLTSPRVGNEKLKHSLVNHSHILVHITISLRSRLEKLKHSQVKSHNHSFIHQWSLSRFHQTLWNIKLTSLSVYVKFICWLKFLQSSWPVAATIDAKDRWIEKQSNPATIASKTLRCNLQQLQCLTT